MSYNKLLATFKKLASVHEQMPSSYVVRKNYKAYSDQLISACEKHPELTFKILFAANKRAMLKRKEDETKAEQEARENVGLTIRIAFHTLGIKF